MSGPDLLEGYRYRARVGRRVCYHIEAIAQARALCGTALVTELNPRWRTDRPSPGKAVCASCLAIYQSSHPRFVDAAAKARGER